MTRLCRSKFGFKLMGNESLFELDIESLRDDSSANVEEYSLST